MQARTIDIDKWSSEEGNHVSNVMDNIDDIENEMMGYTEVIEIINILFLLFKLKLLTLNVESLPVVTRGVGHPSDFNLLPIK